MEGKNVVSLSFAERREHDGEKILSYAIEYEGDKTTIVSINLPLSDRPVKTDEIAFANESFVNGFKVVKTKNGEYGYIREEDNFLLSHRYDIALDFNEYGFAMVGKDGYVTWINRNFDYLASDGTMTMEQDDIPFRAWKKIYAFSEGDDPLSLITGRYYDDTPCCRYIDILGKVKSFAKYKEGKWTYPTLTTFFDATPFNEQGYARADGYILSSKGYMISKSDLEDKSLNAFLPDSIFAFAQEIEEHGRTLKR